MPESTRKQAAPCGAWASPITAAVVAAGSTPLSGVLLDGADASDRMTSWKTSTGDIVWTNESLMFRRLGAPAAIAQSVVYGDYDGMLHWFSRAKGEPQARLTTDGSPITTPPVAVAGVLVVVTRGGGVFAFRPA